MGQVPRVWLGEIEFMKKNIAKLGGIRNFRVLALEKIPVLGK